MVEFFPQKNPFPKVSTDDYLRQAATDIAHILRQPQKSIPTLTYGTPVTNAYVHLAQILKRATEQHTPKQVTIILPPRVKQIEVAPVPAPRVMQEVAPAPVAHPRVRNNKKNNLQSKIHQDNTHKRTLAVKRQHPLVQNRLQRQRMLRPIKARLHRLGPRSVSHEPQFQAQSVKAIDDWMCHVYHPHTALKQS